jgi:RNA polymerase sigma-70 factor (ECF subfamily)
MTAEYPRLLAFARACSGSWAEAEDLTQEAFLAAYRGWSEISLYEQPAAFLRRVVANQAISGRRRRSRDQRLRVRLASRRQPEAEPTLADPTFWRAVGGLPARQRHVVALRHLEDASVAGIAEVLGIAEGTVRAHLHAAHHALAAELDVTLMEEEHE